MLSMRPRGKAKIYHIRGSVSLGERRIDVAEFSSGTSDRNAAAHLMATRETELREQLLFGPKAQLGRATIADALEAYLTKPVRPHPSDILRVGKLNEVIGGIPLSQPRDAWEAFRAERLLDHAPAGQDRYRGVLQAAINVYNEVKGLDRIRIRAIKFSNQRVRFLSAADRDRLIECYSPHVRPIITVLAFQGPRTQEALQLPWGVGGADVQNGRIYFARTKTGVPRSVAMHPLVLRVLTELWESRGRAKGGHVFLNRLGNPFQDTRDARIPGGNPLARAHATACKRASIRDFTIHDWRHHWASQCVMAGIDLPTIMRMGGWKELRMLQRYAAVDTAHMDAAIRKLL